MNRNPLHWNRYTYCRILRSFTAAWLVAALLIVAAAVVALGGLV
ncbi:hypothetical protein [Nocardia carnea]|nr:hypothetical protein [Nocardia carnea]